MKITIQTSKIEMIQGPSYNEEDKIFRIKIIFSDREVTLSNTDEKELDKVIEGLTSCSVWATLKVNEDIK